MTEAGQVRAARYHKFRQINRFLELVQDVVSFLPRAGPLRVVDFGCGKSYLTFALHHLLVNVHGREVAMVGLDRRQDVIDDCRRVAQKLGCRGLEFRTGDIAGFEPATAVDLAVSLHACDTATDDALAQAVRWGCRVILAVPCCQHELAARLDSPALKGLVAHGLLKERFAALATDALRALALEVCGYATQVVEFIDLEHTAKNVLLRAVRRSSSAAPAAQARNEYAELKQLLGIDRLRVDELFGSFERG
jgi:SAM-dependent methyltransferase